MADMVKRKDFLENEVVDLTEEIKLVSPTDTPLTTMLMGRGAVEPATDITVTWRERELNPNRGTLKLEGAEAGEVITSTRGSLSNVCQIIEKVTQVSGTAGALTEDHFLDALQKMWDHGAQGDYFAFVNATQKRAINALAKAGNNVRWVLENGSVANVYGIAVSKIVTDFGEIFLVLDRYMDNDTILTLDLDEVRIAELRGTFYEDLPKAGDYFKGHVINESTIKLLNSYAGSKILVTAGA